MKNFITTPLLIIMNIIHYQVFGSFIYDAIEVTYVMNAQIICGTCVTGAVRDKLFIWHLIVSCKPS